MRSTGMSGIGDHPAGIAAEGIAVQGTAHPALSRGADSSDKLAAVGALAEAGGQQFGGDQVVDRFVAPLPSALAARRASFSARISPIDRRRRSSSMR